MTKHKNQKNKLIPIMIGVSAIICLLFISTLVYLGSYYRANIDAVRAANGSDSVSVVAKEQQLLFDGPGEEKLFVFYPGAHVEFTAYSRLMVRLAENGLDCVLVKMPLNFAILNSDAFDDVRLNYEGYNEYYIGGHSMGGAMAALYASNNPDKIKGLVMLAAYPTKPLEADLKVVSIYGSNDDVLNREKLAEGTQYLPLSAKVFEITGGNHAQFGDYGVQSGDGTASISPEEQQSLTARYIIESL